MGSISGQVTKIPHAVWRGQKNKNNKIKSILDFYVAEMVLLVYMLGETHNKKELLLIQLHFNMNSYFVIITESLFLNSSTCIYAICITYST